MLKQIRYFQSVVRLGSFTAAAEEHFISQSAISQQIKALEEELGVTLLERKKRSFTLTPAGEFFYKKSLVLVADYDNIVRELQKVSGNSGELAESRTAQRLQRQGVQQRCVGIYGAVSRCDGRGHTRQIMMRFMHSCETESLILCSTTSAERSRTSM